MGDMSISIYVKDQQSFFFFFLKKMLLFFALASHWSAPVMNKWIVNAGCICPHLSACRASTRQVSFDYLILVCKYISCRSDKWDYEYVQLCQKRSLRRNNKLCKILFYIQAPAVLKFMLNSPGFWLFFLKFISH